MDMKSTAVIVLLSALAFPVSLPAQDASQQAGIAASTRPAGSATRPAAGEPTGIAASTRPAGPSTRPAIAPDPKLESLIAQLGAESWQTRQKAQEALTQYGPSIRPRIQRLLAESGDEEVRTRAEAILRRLDEGRFSGPSMITLHVKNAPPQDVFAQIAKQSYCELRPSPPDLWEKREWPKISLDVDSRPFWEVMSQVCAKLNVNPQRQLGSARELLIMEGTNANAFWKPNAPSVVSGAFMVVATNITCTHTVDLNEKRGGSRSGSVQFLAFAEPKLRVLQGSYYASVNEAVDEKGNNVSVRAASEFMNPQRELAWRLFCQINPPATSQRIARLKATGKFIVQTRSETAEVPNIASASDVTKIVGGRRFLIKNVEKNGDVYIVHTVFYRAGWSQQEWSSMYNLNASGMINFQLADEQGNGFNRVNITPRGSANDSMTIDIQFQRMNAAGAAPVGEPAKLTWDIPTETREVVVPFEFKDLPIP